MARITKHRQKNRQPTKDRARRGGLYAKCSPETVRIPPVLIQGAMQDQAATAINTFNQSLASLETPPVDTGLAAPRPGPMCIEGLRQSIHHQANLARLETQPVQQP